MEEINNQEIKDAVAKELAVYYKPYLDTIEAALFLGKHPTTLAKYRTMGCGPTYIKDGKSISYKRDDLIAWNDQRRVTNTAQAQEKGLNRASTRQPAP